MGQPLNREQALLHGPCPCLPALLHYMLVFIAFVFSLLHGARRYRWSGILALLIIGVAVSNILEISSITNGFPFGHYHYTNVVAR
jgi:uncharacterized membrane protein